MVNNLINVYVKYARKEKIYFKKLFLLFIVIIQLLFQLHFEGIVRNEEKLKIKLFPTKLLKFLIFTYIVYWTKHTFVI